MTEDLILLVLGTGVLAVGYKIWQTSLDAREAANRIAKDTCSRAVVQFLDGTVAFAGFRLSRGTQGGRRLLRTYTFDYTSDGFERAQGFIVPAGLVARAAAAGVEVLALTDHDTVAGLEEAEHSAVVHGLRLVPGVEISASWRAQAIHVLGLWIDPASAELRSVLKMQAERRRARMRKICARLEKLGLPGPLLLAAVEAQPGLPTRAHLANAMVAGGHVS